LFTAALMRRYPSLPVEEEGRLKDPRLCENFVERLFAYRRLCALFSARWTQSALIQFHAAHKLTLMAHSPKSYNELGRFVANARGVARVEIGRCYQRDFMQALKRPATTARHTNVLHHVLGYLRPHLARDSRDELLTLIDDYRCGLAPLVVPISRFRHYAQKFEIAYLLGQVYLEPHPNELYNRLSGPVRTK
jgi:uncharacterized protein YbgA (DUF1722 family)